MFFLLASGIPKCKVDDEDCLTTVMTSVIQGKTCKR